MKRVQQIIALLIFLLGFRFGLIAPREFANGVAPWPTAFWLLNTSLCFIVCGALNLLSMRYGGIAPGIRVVSTVTNVGLAALVMSAGLVAGEAAPSVVVGLLLITAAVMG